MTSSNAIKPPFVPEARHTSARHILSAMLAVSLSALPICAQQQRMEALCDTLPWLHTLSDAALTCVTQRINYAQADVRLTDGEWGRYGSGTGQTDFGAATSSYFEVRHGLVMAGDVSYCHSTVRGATGSVWLDPDDAPFDMVETDAANAGHKTTETYRLHGAIGYTLLPSLSLGAGIDFTAANRAKDRDLRSQNKLTDLTCSTGMLWSPAAWSLGLTYRYRRTVESLLFKTYGTTGTVYETLIDYGASMGATEYSSADGLSSEDEERPLVAGRHTVALQLGLAPSDGVQWVNEASLTWRSGYYGKRSLFTPVFMEHRAHAWQYSGSLCWPLAHGGRQTLTATAGGTHLQNWQNLFDYVNQGGGLNEYVYYGQAKTRSQHTFDATLRYHLYRGPWLWQAEALWQECSLTASCYPYYRHQRTRQLRIGATSRRQWTHGPHDWSARLDAAFCTGWGTMADDGRYDADVTDSELTRSNLQTLYAALLQNYDWRTAPQADVHLTLQYGRQIDPGLRLYALVMPRLQCAWSTTADVKSHLLALTLAIGCTF